MRVKRLLSVGVGLLLMGLASEARADIIFSVNQGSVNPDENVLFDGCTGCTNGPAMTVIGGTNNTNILVSFTSDENLVADASGQARVQGADGAIDNFVAIDTVDPLLFFSEFETNVRIVSNAAGTGSVVACNQLGDPCETFVLTYGGGENFFVLSVISPQLIDTIRINAGNVDILSIQQTRVSIATDDGDDVTIPEPATLSLLGLGMVFGATRLRKKPSAAE